MSTFPRTEVGGLSVSRLVIGSNWFLGFSHNTLAKDHYIREHVASRGKIADILEVYLNAGVDAYVGLITKKLQKEAIEEAQQRTGKRIIVISTPSLPVTARTALDGFDIGEVERMLDAEAAAGATFLLPHTTTTDRMVDKCSREVRQFDVICKLIRERGMIPGLSTHMPEAIVYADETGLDVETYVSIFNAMGFLMPIEVDWTKDIIHNAKKPVLTIKPMAAGQIRPLQALTFSWNAIRDCDMICAGSMSPEEARELVDLSLAILDRRKPEIGLQWTRSKETVQ